MKQKKFLVALLISIVPLCIFFVYGFIVLLPNYYDSYDFFSITTFYTWLGAQLALSIPIIIVWRFTRNFNLAKAILIFAPVALGQTYLFKSFIID